MASIAGANTGAICQVATTWQTAVAGGANDKLIAEITHSLNEQELIARAVGSGNYMAVQATRGGTFPTVNLTMDAGYRNNMDTLIAQFMGTDSASAEITAGQADYRHTITFNTTLNSKYVSIAYESSSATVHEFPTCAVQAIGFKTTTIPGYCEASFQLLADMLQLTTAVNTNAVIQAATQTDTELISADGLDDFQINASTGGSLSTSNQLNIISYDLSLSRPQKVIGELRNASGVAAPISDGQFEGTLKITLRELADHTYYTIFNAETAQKCKLIIDGTQIGTGSNKSISIYIPKMFLLKAPEYAPIEEGVNAVSYEFRIVKAPSNPTGMTSTYPYFEIINGLSTQLLA